MFNAVVILRTIQTIIDAQATSSVVYTFYKIQRKIKKIVDTFAILPSSSITVAYCNYEYYRIVHKHYSHKIVDVK